MHKIKSLKVIQVGHSVDCNLEVLEKQGSRRSSQPINMHLLRQIVPRVGIRARSLIEPTPVKEWFMKPAIEEKPRQPRLIDDWAPSPDKRNQRDQRKQDQGTKIQARWTTLS